MPSKKNDQIAEQLFEMVDIIADAKLKALQYDKTYKANIVNTDKADLGRYICQMENLRFEAIGGEGEYKVGDTVYVMVPQDNWDNQKHIIGRYVSSKSNAVYISPFEEFFYPSERPFYRKSANSEADWGLIANQNQTANRHDAYADEASHNYSFINLDTGAKIKGYDEAYTTLGVRASFKTTLADWGLLAGEYGLKIRFKDSNNKVIAEQRFTSEDLFGAIYNYPTYFTFEKLFDIDYDTIGASSKIDLVFYENEDFKVADYENATVTGVPLAMFEQLREVSGSISCQKPNWSGQGSSRNIYINNIELYWGYNTKYLKDKDYQLATKDNKKGLSYWTQFSPEENTKNFYYTYLYRDDNNKWHRDTNRISALLRCMGENNGAWEEVKTFPSGLKTPPIQQTITQEEASTTSNTIRFKARLDINGNSVESNILTFYKHDDGTYDCASGEKASEDKDKEEEKTQPPETDPAAQGTELSSTDFTTVWLNGFNMQDFVTGAEIANARPRVWINHKENSKYTDIRISVANGVGDFERLGNKNLLSVMRFIGQSAINDGATFRFAHNVTWESEGSTAGTSDWSHSVFMAINFSTEIKKKIFGTDSNTVANQLWASSKCRPLYLDIPQIWKASYYYNSVDNPRPLLGGQWGVICRCEKLGFDKNMDPNDAQSCIYNPNNTPCLLLYAQEILDGLNQNYYNYAVNMLPIMYPDDNINNIFCKSYKGQYLECILTLRITW